MILKAIPQKDKNEFELIDDIRVIAETKKKFGDNFYIYQFPKLPVQFNRTYYSKDERVNLFDFTCTCEEFNKNKIHYTERDIRKACKHIYYKASSNWLKKYIDPITLLMLKAVVSNSINYLYKIIIYGKVFYLIINPESAWIKVVTTNDENKGVEYFYHTIQKRWGYSKNPDDKFYLVDQIQKVIKYQLPVDHPYKTFSELEKY